MQVLARVVIGIVIIFLGVMVSRGLMSLKKDPPQRVQIEGRKFAKGQLISNQDNIPKIEIQGRVGSQNKIEVFAEVGGRLLPQSKEFREGNRFSKGEAILRVDDQETRLSLQAQKSSLLQLLTSSLADVKIDYPDSYDEWMNYTSKFEVSDRLKAIPEFKSDAEKFFFSNRGILNQYYNILSAESRLEKFVVRAPYSGVVTASSINPGTIVRVGQKLGEFSSLKSFEIEAAVTEYESDQIKIGQTAIFRTDDNEEIEGKVIRIAESVDPNTQSRKVFCEVDEANITDGAYYNGVILGSPVPQSSEISTELLVGDSIVFGLRDSILFTIPIELVHKSSKVSIVKGIASGTSILATPISGAYNGMIVKVNN